METKHIIITAVIIVVVIVAFPVVYTNWPRDPQPEVDIPKITQMHQALAKYYKDFGEFPQSLNYLVPNYIPEISEASTRQPFKYNPQNGQITTPYPLKEEDQQELNRRGGGGFGAGGPMGEVMTGISIQNELNY